MQEQIREVILSRFAVEHRVFIKLTREDPK
jgi:hypothetical protein